jgi:hypothetical protein
MSVFSEGVLEKDRGADGAGRTIRDKTNKGFLRRWRSEHKTLGYVKIDKFTTADKGSTSRPRHRLLTLSHAKKSVRAESRRIATTGTFCGP